MKITSSDIWGIFTSETPTLHTFYPHSLLPLGYRGVTVGVTTDRVSITIIWSLIGSVLDKDLEKYIVVLDYQSHHRSRRVSRPSGPFDLWASQSGTDPFRLETPPYVHWFLFAVTGSF